MTTAAAGFALGLTLAAGLWPFGDRPPAAERATVGSLKARPAELPPPTAAAAVDIGDEAAARERAMAQYRQFLALDAGPAAMRREAMRRLADLNLEAGAEAEAASEQGDAGVAYYREAVRLYTALLADPEAGDRDQVLYQLSRAQDGAGDGSAALASLDRLAADHPAGRNADEAQFRRGETYFVRQDYVAAEAAYAAVLASGVASPFYEQSLYKHGWALFKQGRHEESLASFLPLLDRRLGGPGDTTVVQARLDDMGRAERELIDDTLRVTAITLEYTGGAPAVPAALATTGEPAWSWLVYQALGDLYLDKQRYRDAAEAYVAYVETSPGAEPAPALQQAAIDAYTRGKFPSLVLTAKQQYVERYGLDGDWWRQRGGLAGAGAVGARVAGELKTHLTDLAGHDHALAQQSKAPADYARAAGWYERFLAYFPDDPDAAERSFLLGELQFEARQFAAARDAYLRAAYGYPGYGRAAEAGYAALLAAREQEQRLDGEARTTWHAATREQALSFAAAFPAHPEAGAVLTNVAEDFFASGDLARAEQVAGLVLTLQPPAAPELERVAWTVTAHAQFDLGRYADAEGSYLRLRTYTLPEAQRAEVDARIAASVYRQGEQAAAAGRVDEAVNDYLRVAAVVPDAAIRPNAVYDAATLLLNNRRWGEAGDLLRQFRRDFPAHQFNDDVTAKLAVVLREDGRSAEAAAEYERIAGAEATAPDLARESLWQAAELYGRAGARADEARTLERIVERFPSPFAEAQEARQKLADLAAADSPARQRWLQAVVAADTAAGDARTERSRYLAARASLELARPARDAFMAATLTMPLKPALQRKRQRMEEALAAYARAAAYGVGEVTTAATYETGELYYQLSRDLLASPRPADLDADALEQYELLLEEQAFPFEEKAQELYRANIARAAEGVWDEWVQASYARLAAIAPARYAREERSTDVATWID
jgi:TolA-binding protein